MIEAVVLDVGETLVNETRIWLRWADRLGVTPLVMMGLVGATAANDLDLRHAFELVAPGFDLEAELRRWAEDEPGSMRSGFDADDLYEDVIPALEALDALAIPVWIAGNQPPEARSALAGINLPVRAVINSSDLGVEKPDLSFFHALSNVLGIAPERIVYVGDRLDNDVLPALEAGFRAVLMRRGPWGFIHSQRSEASSADAVCETLLDLPALIRSL